MKKLAYSALLCCFCSFVFGANQAWVESDSFTQRMRCTFPVRIQFDVTDLPSGGSQATSFNMLLDYGGTDFDTVENISRWPAVNVSNASWAYTPELFVTSNFTSEQSNGLIATVDFTPSNVSSADIAFLISADNKGLMKNSGGGTDGTSYVDGNYTLLALPCTDDTNAPRIRNISPSINGGTKITNTDGFAFELYDWRGTSSAGYLTDPANITNIANYQDSYAWDNQWGVNADSIEFTLSSTDAGFTTQTFGPNQATTAGRNIGLTADGVITWNRNDRNYLVNIDSISQDYGIEKAMNLYIYAEDNTGNVFTRNYTFNSPVAPWLTDTALAGSVEVVPMTDLAFTIRDDWAGVNSGNVIVRVYNRGTGGTEMNLIGTFLSPPTSGPPLNLSETTSSANTPDIAGQINGGYSYLGSPFTFPVPTTGDLGNTIRVEVDAYDNEGTAGGGTFEFVTRRACGFYPGCSNPLKIFMSGGDTIGQYYYDQELFVTGATAPYPYIEDQIVDCGPDQTNQFLLTGNIANPQIYSGSRLYISWGVATVSGNKLIIESL